MMSTITITAPGSGTITVGGSGPFDPPSGITTLDLECWGAGATSTPAAGAESGGASGAYSRATVAVVDGSVLTYRLPAGTPSGTVGGGGPCTVLFGATFACIADSAYNPPPPSVSTAGLAANGEGDVKFSGASGQLAQGGGGSRGGSGGSSSGGPNGAGAQGAQGSKGSGGIGGAALADAGAGGKGAAGGVSGASGSDGIQPGGGGGGGGSGPGSNGGRGGDGQIRFSW